MIIAPQAPGTYEFFCTLHPDDHGKVTLVVEPSSFPTPAVAAPPPPPPTPTPTPEPVAAEPGGPTTWEVAQLVVEAVARANVTLVTDW